MHKPVVVIPNLNGGNEVIEAIESLLSQTLKPFVVVVDNASTDGSPQNISSSFPGVKIISNSENKGYAGGVNPGIQLAIEEGAKYVAPFNDDAKADVHWLETLVSFLELHEEYAAVTCKVLKSDGNTIDSTGDFYTNWGLTFPRGRDEIDSGQYDNSTEVFTASGAASLFRVSALHEVGLFDEDFFAYYEDVDLGFRLQLAGWKIGFSPEAIVYHKIGMTSSRIKGFTTYQTLKNLPLLWWKNMPKKYLFKTGWRLSLALFFFWVRAIIRGQFVPASSGFVKSLLLIFKKRNERNNIQDRKKLTDDEVWDLLIHDLPKNALALRKIRSFWWRLARK